MRSSNYQKYGAASFVGILAVVHVLHQAYPKILAKWRWTAAFVALNVPLLVALYFKQYEPDPATFTEEWIRNLDVNKLTRWQRDRIQTGHFNGGAYVRVFGIKRLIAFARQMGMNGSAWWNTLDIETMACYLDAGKGSSLPQGGIRPRLLATHVHSPWGWRFFTEDTIEIDAEFVQIVMAKDPQHRIRWYNSCKSSGIDLIRHAHLFVDQEGRVDDKFSDVFILPSWANALDRYFELKAQNLPKSVMDAFIRSSGWLNGEPEVPEGITTNQLIRISHDYPKVAGRWLSQWMLGRPLVACRSVPPWTPAHEMASVKMERLREGVRKWIRESGPPTGSALERQVDQEISFLEETEKERFIRNKLREELFDEEKERIRKEMAATGEVDEDDLNSFVVISQEEVQSAYSKLKPYQLNELLREAVLPDARTRFNRIPCIIRRLSDKEKKQLILNQARKGLITKDEPSPSDSDVEEVLRNCTPLQKVSFLEDAVAPIVDIHFKRMADAMIDHARQLRRELDERLFELLHLAPYCSPEALKSYCQEMDNKVAPGILFPAFRNQGMQALADFMVLVDWRPWHIPQLMLTPLEYLQLCKCQPRLQKMLDNWKPTIIFKAKEEEWNAVLQHTPALGDTLALLHPLKASKAPNRLVQLVKQHAENK